MKRSLKKYGAGGQTPLQYTEGQQVTNSLGDMAGAIPGIGTAIGVGIKGLNAIDSLTSDEYGAPKSGVAGIVNRLNPIGNVNNILEGKDVGRSLLNLTPLGTLGEVSGLSKKVFGESDFDKEATQRKKIENQYKDYANFQKSQVGYSNNSKTTNGLTFAEGGVIPEPTAELELNEQFQLPNGQVGEVDGASHENGGVPVALPEGTRVFSDRLKYNGKTFAKLTKPINNRINKLEESLENNSTDNLKKNSLMLMNKQLDHYFNIQETNKQNEQMKRSFKYAKGGTIKDPWEELGKQNSTMLDNPDGTIPFPIKRNETNFQTIEPNIGITGASSKKISPLSRINNLEPNLSKQSSDFNLSENAGEIGQVGAALLTTALQNRNLNKINKPKTLTGVKLADKVVNPNLVDYSAQRNAIDQGYLEAADSAQRNLSNSATAQAFKNQANLQRLQGTGASWQDESNTNTQIKNQFLNQKTQAAMQEALVNNDIDKYNLENVYGFDTMKASEKNKLLAQLGNTAGQTFGNKTKYQNQLDQAEILSHQYNPSVYKDANGNVIKLPKGKNGGTLKKRSFKK